MTGWSWENTWKSHRGLSGEIAIPKANKTDGIIARPNIVLHLINHTVNSDKQKERDRDNLMDKEVIRKKFLYKGPKAKLENIWFKIKWNQFDQLFTIIQFSA